MRIQVPHGKITHSSLLTTTYYFLPTTYYIVIMFEQILSLDTQLTLWFNGSDSLFVDTLAASATKTRTWVPLGALLMYVLVRMKNWKHLLLIILGIALAITLADQVASGLFKPMVGRLRPSHNPDLVGLIDLVNGYTGGRYGFFSSHAANTCAVAVFLSLIFRQKLFVVLIASWCLLNCWTRLYLGVHYVGDILTGLLWGCIVGWVVFRLYKYLLAKFKVADMQPEFQLKHSLLLSEGIMLTYAALIVYAACCTII